MQIDVWSLQGTLLPMNDSIWKHNGYCMGMKQSACPISNDIIHSIFPRGNKKNRNRALLLIKSDPMQHLSIKHIKCASRLNNNLTILQFKMNVTPSMKMKVKNTAKGDGTDQLDEFCTAFASFDLRAKKLLHYPYSACGYYDGRHVCSHFASFLFFVHCAQMCNYNQTIFESTLPENPIKLQNTLTLIENVSNNESRIKAAKRKFHEKESLHCNDEI